MSNEESRRAGPSRREFLASGPILAATAGTMVGASAGSAPERAEDPPPPVELPPLFAKTEKTSAGPPSALPPAKRVGYAVVGLGHLTLEQILPAFARCKRSKLAALVSGDRAKADRVARQHGLDPSHVYDYASYDRIRDDSSIEAVYIVLPNSMHLEFTERAAKAGKHVLSEKPMAASSRQAEAMIAACESAKKILMIAYRCQYEPHHRALIEIARKKDLGAVRMISAENVQNQGDPEQWRQKRALAGGGSLPDIGLYCLNAARYLTGEEPVEVSAQIRSDPKDPRFREVEDRVTFSLAFPSGVLASLQTSYSAHEARKLRMLCEAGWAEMDPAFSYTGLRLRTARAEGSRELVTEQKIDDADQFALEIDHMSECIASGRRPRTPGEEGLQDHRLMEAIYESAREAKTVKIAARDGLDIFRGPPL